MGDWLNVMNLITVSGTSYTILSGDEQSTYIFTSATGCVLTVPLNATTFFPPGTTFAAVDITSVAPGGVVVGGPGAGSSGGSAGGVTIISLAGYRTAGFGAGWSLTNLSADQWWLSGATII